MNEEEVKWEIMEMEDVNQEQTNNVLATFDDKKLAKNQKFIKDVLAELTFEDDEWNVQKVTPELLIKQVYEESNKAMLMNNKWDLYPDHKSRFNMKMKLLESVWVVKKDVPDIKINFLSLLFNK